MRIRECFYAGTGNHGQSINYMVGYINGDVNNVGFYAEIDVPDGASDDYGYRTLKRAVSVRMPHADIEWWYGQDAQLEDDASARGTVRISIKIDPEQDYVDEPGDGNVSVHSVAELRQYVDRHGKLPTVVADPDKLDEYSEYVESQVPENPEDLSPESDKFDMETLKEAYTAVFVSICLILDDTVDANDAWEIFMDLSRYGELYREVEE